jgi:hypothetical protein
MVALADIVSQGASDRLLAGCCYYRRRQQKTMSDVIHHDTEASRVLTLSKAMSPASAMVSKPSALTMA